MSTQNITDPALGHRILDLLEKGATAPEALAQVVASASHIEYRQLSVVDASGATAVYSGARTLGTHHTEQGDGAVAAGNLLSSTGVPAAMMRTFQDLVDAPLAERLIATLQAGVDAGGEEGPVQSAGVIVYDQASYPLTDLRVDWADEPIAQLAEIWRVWEPQAEDYYLRSVNPSAAPSYGVAGDL